MNPPACKSDTPKMLKYLHFDVKMQVFWSRNANILKLNADILMPNSGILKSNAVF
jgi:hypothetical protein